MARQMLSTEDRVNLILGSFWFQGKNYCFDLMDSLNGTCETVSAEHVHGATPEATRQAALHLYERLSKLFNNGEPGTPARADADAADAMSHFIGNDPI